MAKMTIQEFIASLTQSQRRVLMADPAKMDLVRQRYNITVKEPLLKKGLRLSSVPKRGIRASILTSIKGLKNLPERGGFLQALASGVEEGAEAVKPGWKPTDFAGHVSELGASVADPRFLAIGGGTGSLAKTLIGKGLAKRAVRRFARPVAEGAFLGGVQDEGFDPMGAGIGAFIGGGAASIGPVARWITDRSKATTRQMAQWLQGIPKEVLETWEKNPAIFHKYKDQFEKQAFNRMMKDEGTNIDLLFSGKKTINTKTILNARDQFMKRVSYWKKQILEQPELMKKLFDNKFIKSVEHKDKIALVKAVEDLMDKGTYNSFTQFITRIPGMGAIGGLITGLIPKTIAAPIAVPLLAGQFPRQAIKMARGLETGGRVLSDVGAPRLARTIAARQAGLQER